MASKALDKYGYRGDICITTLKDYYHYYHYDHYYHHGYEGPRNKMRHERVTEQKRIMSLIAPLLPHRLLPYFLHPYLAPLIFSAAPLYHYLFPLTSLTL